MERGIRAVLSTDGTLVNRQTAKKIREAGFSYVGISMDSTSPQWHDSFRGVGGSFARALEGARILSKTLKSLARGKSVSPEEILNEVSRGSVERIVKKILALALEEKSLASADFTETLEILLKTLSTSSE